MAELGSVAWPPAPIRTERLVLRESESRDRAAFIELFTSPEVGTYIGGPRPRDELERALARLGLLNGMPACTDMKSRPYVEACDVTVLDAPFHAEGNIATAGGCLASQYLATWVITRILGEDAARAVIDYVAPVGENQETVERALHAVHAGVVALR
ncbi:hypothetical protein [Streptomyces ochraceiscleroticus]|uniref:N-acetyltransferase domain-containing protein n=1 Tax=Streptomyces ochraceiscleroticus TaxID=47761 RepID=A0ABW1MKS1_9ACTN|nr:hypothetical protein [Streptomyces ochraceiscleroticus]